MQTKIMIVGSSKNNSNSRRARIRLSGLWLIDYGFNTGKFLTVSCKNGCITFNAVNTDYKSVVKAAFKNNLKVLQVLQEKRNGILVPIIDIKGNWVSDIGFLIGSIFIMQSNPESITLRLVDVNKITFDS